MITRHSTEPYAGFILEFEAARSEKIDAALRYGRKEATETFSAVDWTFFPQELVLLSLDPDDPGLHAAALMEKMKVNGATGKYKMRLHAPVMFDPPVSLSELPRGFRKKNPPSTSIDLRRLSSSDWNRLLDTIRRVRPSAAKPLDALAVRRSEDRRIFPTSDRKQLLMEQRDAIGIAVDIAGLDRRNILKTLQPNRVERADSVLDLLDAELLQEQDAIRKDEAAFGQLLQSGMRHARFANRLGAEVRIHVYDKKPLETTVGIDLLIYQARYQSYILIQYKMMDAARTEAGKWSYTVDKHLLQQLDAMNRVADLFTAAGAIPEPLESWRLSNEVFFWKFCEPTRLADSPGALTHGLTLARPHLHSFLSLPQSAGRGTSRKVGYGNCDRYLTNSQFVDLASAGWIGGGANAQTLIEDLLLANQEGGRQTILAAIKQAEIEGQRVRGWKQ